MGKTLTDEQKIRDIYCNHCETKCGYPEGVCCIPATIAIKEISKLIDEAYEMGFNDAFGEVREDTAQEIFEWVEAYGKNDCMDCIAAYPFPPWDYEELKSRYGGK